MINYKKNDGFCICYVNNGMNRIIPVAFEYRSALPAY